MNLIAIKFGECTLTFSNYLKKIDKTFKQTTYLSKKKKKKKKLPLLFNRPNTFFIITITDILNHFSLRLVNVGIIHQKLEEVVAQIKSLITSFLFS